eukprot:TRINITY_DN61142_c0_g1_i1.p2 TRINITY_DN61142_c0_g1~~TRINITY_DN61142_c0_g1_i1.p2  ORF type:complete len:540 (+),score=236.27 TRINITY_DN61142_c0_g1_i1:77-1621(+)
MARLARQQLEAEEVHFCDADGDKVGLRAEVLGGRGRVVLMCGGVPHPQIPFVKRLMYSRGDRKLYVNGHEAVIPLNAGARIDGEREDSMDHDGAPAEEERSPLERLIARIGEVMAKGKVPWGAADTVDAAAELAKVREEEIDELEAEGLTPEQLARLQAQKAREVTRKKRVQIETVEQLTSMGFTEARAKRALALCDGTTLEVALAWLEAHQTDPDIDEPVPADKEPEWVRPLTQEEKAAKVKELEEQLAQKKKQRLEEERRANIARELKRREDAQQMRDLREEHEKQLRMKAYEEKKRQREEDLRAKAELRRKLNEDRIAKGWDPLPEVEPPKPAAAAGGGATAAAAAELFAATAPAPAPAADDDWDPWGGRGPPGAAAAAPAAAPAAPVLPPRPLPDAAAVPLPGKDLTIEALQRGVDRITAENAQVDAQRCLQALQTYATNIVAQPMDPRFRTISLTSKGFTSRVAGISGGVEVLYMMGYRPRGGKELFMTSLHIPTVASAVQMLRAAASA